MTKLEIINSLVTVQVTHDKAIRPETHWILFAQYPNRKEAQKALVASKIQGYSFARITVREDYDLS